MTLHQLRAEIDAVDAQLLRLLVRRAGIVRDVWTLKQAEGMAPLDAAREAEVLARLADMGEQAGLDRADVERIWRGILRVQTR